MRPEALQIGEAARKTGISIDAIRFYEKAGLLPPPARTTGGYFESGLADAFKQCRKASRQSAKHPDCCPVVQQFGNAHTGKEKA